MTPKELRYSATVTNDGMKIINRKQFDIDIQLFNGANVEVVISKKKKTRSLQQNSYYWSAVVPIVRQALKDSGIIMSSEDTHELLKFNCNLKEHVNAKTGEVLTSIGSTKNLSTVEFMDYIAEIKRWSAEFLNIVIPDPAEVLHIEFN